MKSIKLVFCLLLFCSTAFAKVHLVGKIDNPGDLKNVKLYYESDYNVLENINIPLDSNHRIDFTLDSFYGNFGMLFFENNVVNIFLKDNKHIKFSVDYSNFNSTLKYEGDLAAENNYLALENLNNITSELNTYSMYSDANIYKNHVYKIMDLNRKIWNDYSKANLDKSFITEINTSLQYKHVNPLWMYKIGYNNKDFKYFEKFTPPDYFSFLDSININNQLAVENSDYSVALMRYLFEKFDKNSLKYLPDSLSQSQKFKISFVSKYNYRKSILKEHALEYALLNLYKLSIKIIDSTNKQTSDSIYKDMMSICKNSNIKTWLDNYYKKINVDGRYDKTVDFAFEDASGKVVKLSDFKGKVIYVDFWATWCKPCLANFPDSKKLMTDLRKNKDLVFLYINVDDDLNSWRFFINKNKMDGTFVYANDKLSKELRTYFNFSGIPNYVIIGRDGKVFNPKASDPKYAKQEIQSALK